MHHLQSVIGPAKHFLQTFFIRHWWLDLRHRHINFSWWIHCVAIDWLWSVRWTCFIYIFYFRFWINLWSCNCSITICQWLSNSAILFCQFFYSSTEFNRRDENSLAIDRLPLTIKTDQFSSVFASLSFCFFFSHSCTVTDTLGYFIKMIFTRNSVVCSVRNSDNRKIIVFSHAIFYSIDWYIDRFFLQSARFQFTIGARTHLSIYRRVSPLLEFLAVSNSIDRLTNRWDPLDFSTARLGIGTRNWT